VPSVAIHLPASSCFQCKPPQGRPRIGLLAVGLASERLPQEPLQLLGMQGTKEARSGARATSTPPVKERVRPSTTTCGVEPTKRRAVGVKVRRSFVID
jgi:hypothetical protein